jgi:hypothetical protein
MASCIKHRCWDWYELCRLRTVVWHAQDPGNTGHSSKTSTTPSSRGEPDTDDHANFSRRARKGGS